MAQNHITELCLTVELMSGSVLYLAEFKRHSTRANNKMVRLQEHRSEVESKTKPAFARSQCTASLTEHNKSALTNHATQQNHTIHWKKAAVIDRESDQPTRWIKEAVHIQTEGQWAMNQDMDSYQLSHAYDRFFDAIVDRQFKSRKDWVPASDEDLS